MRDFGLVGCEREQLGRIGVEAVWLCIRDGDGGGKRGRALKGAEAAA
jgi:hypothetical protein